MPKLANINVVLNPPGIWQPLHENNVQYWASEEQTRNESDQQMTSSHDIMRGRVPSRVVSCDVDVPADLRELVLHIDTTNAQNAHQSYLATAEIDRLITNESLERGEEFPQHNACQPLQLRVPSYGCISQKVRLDGRTDLLGQDCVGTVANDGVITVKVYRDYTADANASQAAPAGIHARVHPPPKQQQRKGQIYHPQGEPSSSSFQVQTNIDRNKDTSVHIDKARAKGKGEGKEFVDNRNLIAVFRFKFRYGPGPFMTKQQQPATYPVFEDSLVYDDVLSSSVLVKDDRVGDNGEPDRTEDDDEEHDGNENNLLFHPLPFAFAADPPIPAAMFANMGMDNLLNSPVCRDQLGSPLQCDLQQPEFEEDWEGGGSEGMEGLEELEGEGRSGGDGGDGTGQLGAQVNHALASYLPQSAVGNAQHASEMDALQNINQNHTQTQLQPQPQPQGPQAISQHGYDQPLLRPQPVRAIPTSPFGIHGWMPMATQPPYSQQLSGNMQQLQMGAAGLDGFGFNGLEHSTNRAENFVPPPTLEEALRALEIEQNNIQSHINEVRSQIQTQNVARNRNFVPGVSGSDRRRGRAMTVTVPYTRPTGMGVASSSVGGSFGIGQAQGPLHLGSSFRPTHTAPPLATAWQVIQNLQPVEYDPFQQGFQLPVSGQHVPYPEPGQLIPDPAYVDAHNIPQHAQHGSLLLSQPAQPMAPLGGPIMQYHDQPVQGPMLGPGTAQAQAQAQQLHTPSNNAPFVQRYDYGGPMSQNPGDYMGPGRGF